MEESTVRELDFDFVDYNQINEEACNYFGEDDADYGYIIALGDFKPGVAIIIGEFPEVIQNAQGSMKIKFKHYENVGLEG